MQAGRQARRPLLLCLLLSAGASLVAAGCLGPVRTFEGEHPSSEVATVEMGVLGRIEEIDGRDWDGKSFEVLPGEHHLRFFVQVRGEEIHEFLHRRVNFECQAMLDARPGRAYRIVRTPVKYGDRSDQVGIYKQEFELVISIEDAQDEASRIPAEACHLE